MEHSSTQAAVALKFNQEKPVDCSRLVANSRIILTKKLLIHVSKVRAKVSSYESHRRTDISDNTSKGANYAAQVDS